MAYATQILLVLHAGGQASFDQLFDFDGDGVADADAIARAQAAADGWIDQYLRLRYVTPIATPTETLKGLAADEAIYQIKKWKPALGVTPQDVEERTQRMHELEAMRDGKNRPDEPAPAKSSAVKAEFVENCGDVSRKNLRGLF